MNLNDTEKGMAISLAAHFLAFLLIGIAGFQTMAKWHDERVYTVAVVSGHTASAKKSSAKPAPSKARESPKNLENSTPLPDTPAMASEISDASEPMEESSSTFGESGEPAATEAQGGSEGSGTAEEPSGPSFDTEAIQADVSPTLSGTVPAAYPEALRRRGIEGEVQVQMVVGKDGSVESATVISSSGYGLMDKAAVNAAYGYTFSPAYKEEIPVRCYAVRTFRFRLT